jgi:hypothetical protein
VQPPGALHTIEHDDEPLHFCVHAPSHVSAHVDASPHVYLHAPPSGQLSAHAVPGGQSHDHGAPDVGPHTKPCPLPYVGAVSVVPASNVVALSFDVVLTSSGVPESLPASELWSSLLHARRRETRRT